MRRGWLSMVLGATLVLQGCDEEGETGRPAAAPPPPEVGVVVLHPRQIPLTATLPGRIVPSSVAEIRPQVSGIVRERRFQEGTRVAAGDVLYVIDDRAYAAARDAAQASVARAEAVVENARLELDRRTQLLSRNTVAQQVVDTARATLAQAEADLALARANLQAAVVNLDNTTVRAPISGAIGTSSVTEGALVVANQANALATVRQIDPIYVDMTEAGETVIRVRRMIDQGRLDVSDQGPTVRLTLGDGTVYQETGRIEALEGVVSETTGAITIRASFPNPSGILLPGLYVRATVTVGNRGEAFLLPQRAVSRNPKGEATALFLAADGTAEMRVLQTLAIQGNAWVVRSGVQDGDRLIVDGVQKAMAGQPVRAVEVELDDNGVARRAPDPATGPTPGPAAGPT